MKIAARLLTLMTLVAVVTLYTGCGGDDPKGKSTEDKQIELLNGRWALTGAPMLGTTPQEGYDNFELDLSGSAGDEIISYETFGRPEASAWSESGTFEFGDPVESELVREDDVIVTYAVTETTLTVSFQYSGDPIAGRVNSVEGVWVFEFEKQ